MIHRDYANLSILLVLAIFIWTRDISWIDSIEDTLPIVMSLPLFLWLAQPLPFNKDLILPSFTGLFISTVGFITGIIIDSCFVLAVFWTMIMWFLFSPRLDKDKRPAVKRLLILPLLAFPWLFIEGDFIGWWFRLSSAWVSAHIFSFMGFDVLHEGTHIIVQGLPVGIGNACSGLNTLQSMLIAGSALAYIYLGDRVVYWLDLILIIALAWTANTIRIIIICISALTISPKFALGMFHTWGGWIVLFLMICLSWMLFASQRAYYLRTSSTA